MSAVAARARAARDELARRALAEIERRRGSAEYRAFVEATIRSELFGLQLAVLDDPSSRISWCCSRRAGKTEGAVRMLALALEAAGEDEYVVFGARTLGIARDLAWKKLVRLGKRLHLGWNVNQANHEITTARGAEFRLFGVDDSASVEKVRGKKYRLVICDEASTYQEHIEKLLRDCFSPGTKDFDPPGRIIVAGTPGYVCAGFWHDISWLTEENAQTNQQRALTRSWKRHAWILDVNPHIPNVTEALREEREAWGLTEDDPVYLREYRGQWINDGASLVYAYDQQRNAITELPEPPRGKALDQWIREDWLVTLGADIGYVDDFALVVLGSPPNSRDVYALYAFKQAGMLTGAQADMIHEARKRFRPSRTVVDTGGQGKLSLEEFNARYATAAGGSAMAAEKQGKVEAIGLMNSNLRIPRDQPELGRFFVYTPEAFALAEEWMHLPWANKDKAGEHKAFPKHASDAALYCWRAHRGFKQPDKQPEPTDAEREQQRREERMRKERERQQREKRDEYRKRFG